MSRDRTLSRSFGSILFEDGASPEEAHAQPQEPQSFADLNLDQVVAAITADRDTYDLEPFFWAPLPTAEAIAYRHEVFRDLEDETLASRIASFSHELRDMHKRRAQAAKLHDRYEQEAWMLHAARTYCDAVTRLAHDLASVNVASRGLRAFRDHLIGYVESGDFTTLVDDTEKLTEALSGVQYNLTIESDHIKVSRYESEADYSVLVEQAFAKFKQGAVKDYRATFRPTPSMNHVETGVLDLVARLYPDVFAALYEHCQRHRDYLDATVATFDREVQFYLAYLAYIKPFETAGLKLCYPQVCAGSKEIYACEAFDIALANKLVPERSSVVCNDFALTDPERLIVVSGPNQGGKTTFARMFGQLHHLASIGCLVPGRAARLHLFDQLFTHFEREENMTTLSGKLEDDLVRVHEILQRATSDSVVIMNESFTSTTLRDALVLGRAVMEQMIELDLLCVYVTFVDELASLSESTVSMVSTVVPEDPASRTYVIVRRPADGLAYAAVIAEKYGLTYDGLKARVVS